MLVVMGLAVHPEWEVGPATATGDNIRSKLRVGGEGGGFKVESPTHQAHWKPSRGSPGPFQCFRATGTQEAKRSRQMLNL